MSTVLADKDVNAAVVAAVQNDQPVKDVKSMEYHRQVLASKMADEKYVAAGTAADPPPVLTLDPGRSSTSRRRTTS